MFPALAGAQAAAIQSDKVYLAQVMLCARHIGIELDSEHFYIAERAREVFFAGLFVNSLLLFAPTDVHRRAVWILVPAYLLLGLLWLFGVDVVVR